MFIFTFSNFKILSEESAHGRGTLRQRPAKTQTTSLAKALCNTGHAKALCNTGQYWSILQDHVCKHQQASVKISKRLEMSEAPARQSIGGAYLGRDTEQMEGMRRHRGGTTT